MEKICSQCGSTGPFPKRGGPKCQQCYNAYFRQWRADHPVETKARNSEYYWRNHRDVRNHQNAAKAIERLQDTEKGYTTRIEIRLEPDLKEWIIAQGGSDFVRSLLKAARGKRS